MSDTELRILGLRLADECECPKATTQEVLDMARAIYAFLKAEEDAGVEARRRPN
jgi:hypothetical protein